MASSRPRRTSGAGAAKRRVARRPTRRAAAKRRPRSSEPADLRIILLVVLLDRAWAGPSWHGPSVREALEGVSAREAAERPILKSHTIGELVRHMATWKRAVAHRLRGRPYRPSAAENFPPFHARDWSKVRRTLTREHKALREAILELTSERFSEPAVPGGSLVWVQAHGIVHHDLWHAGQILTLRRALESKRRGS